MQQPQPYFKPLQFSGNVLNERNNNNVAGGNQPFFAPIKSHVLQTSVSESQPQVEVRGDRLSSLHSRLHQEAEKIRKWKTQTEIDLKQKDRKIQESTQTVESLRKAILDMQLQNESLSLHLQEEIDKQQEIEKKISATRHLCNALKECSKTTEQRLQNCETERTELMYLNKDHMKQFEELARQFQELEISATHKYNDLKNKLQEETLSKKEMEKSYREKLEETTDKACALEKAKSECEDKIQHLSENLALEEKRIATLKEELERAEEQVKISQEEKLKEAETNASLNSELTTLKEAHGSLMKDFEETSAKLKETIANRDKMSSNFDETEKLYVQRIKCVQDELQETHVKLHKTSKELNECGDTLADAETLVEELKCSKDMLMLERAQDQKKIEGLEEDKNLLAEKLNDLSAQLTSAKDDGLEKKKLIEELEVDIEKLKIDIKDGELVLKTEKQRVDSLLAEKEKLESSLTVAENNRVLLEEQLGDQKERAEEAEKMLEELQGNLKSESEEHQSLNQKMSGLKAENKTLTKELQTLKKDIQKAKKDIEKTEKKEIHAQEKLNEVNEEVFALRNQLDEVETKYKGQLEELDLKLQEEKNTLAISKQELESKSKTATDFEGKTKNLKTEITAKNKQIKELEKEIRTLKGQVTLHTKTSANIEDDYKDLQAELSATKETMAKLEKELENVTAEVDKTKDDLQKARKEATDSKKSCDKATKEKDAKVKETEIRVKDLMSVLDKYKKEKEELLQQKSEEVVKIKTDLEKKSSSAQVKYNKELEDAKREVTALKAELEKQLADKEDHNTSIIEQTDKISEMEQVLKDREKALESKVLQVSSMKKRLDDYDKLKREMNSLKEKMNKQQRLAAVPIPPATPTRRQAKTPMRNTRPPRFNESPEAPMDVTNVMATPQRSILKPSMSISSAKRRKVSFMSKNSDDDSDRSSNSSGEMMEVEIDTVTMTPRIKSGGTPIYLKPSPKTTVRDQTFLTPKPKPRGPPVSKKPKVPSEHKFQPKNAYDERKTQKSVGKVTPFVKQTPKRTPGKFFKSPQTEKKKRPEASSVAWLDSADPYGFADDD